MTSSLREKLRTTACRAGLVLLLGVPSLLLGQRVDSASQSSASGRTASSPITLDRYTIDVVTVVRDGTARTLTDVLISQVPGLLVIPGSGLNGGGASVRFAGVRSLAADVPPLVFLDGMRIDAREDDSQLVTGGPGPSRLDDIPVEDVQFIEVLRGPANAALYGPGAAAGVILIHTKEGQSGDVRISGFAQGALRELPSRWPANYGAVDADNPNVFMQNGGCTLATQAAGGCVQDFIRSFNPLVERNPFASAPHRQLGLSASGGPRWGTFRVSGSLDGDAAVYSVPAVTWADDYRQWNFRANATIRPTEIVDLAASVARLSSTLHLPMYRPVRAALMGSSDSTGFSWAPWFYDPGTQDLDRTQLAIGVHVRPQPWLTLHAAFGRDDVNEHELQVIPGQSRTTGQRTGRDQTVAFSATASNLAWRGMHLTTALGVEKLELRDDARLMLIRPDTVTSCGPSGPNPCSFMSRRILRDVSSLGLYAMQRVAIRERLMVTGTLRHDDFADFDAWSSTHPSVSVDWVARPDRPGTLGRVALRAAYGSAAPPLPDILETFLVGPAQPPPVKPDASRELEFSAEAGGLGGRWRAHAALYDLRTKGLQLVPVGNVPFFNGYAYVPGAELSNRGISATVWASVIDRASLGWDVRLSLWGNRNRLTKQRVPPFFYWGAGARQTGQASFEGFPANGYWSIQTGFVDANGDGIITTSEVSRIALAWAGTPYPTQGAALTSSWRLLRHWRVTATMDYRAGQTLFNETANSRCMFQRCRERFDPATPLADQANAVAASMLPPGYFEDADYLKLRELAIAFDVPERIASTLGARAATIMFGGRDLATWTRYSGADPESGSYGQHDLAQPVLIGDFATVPAPRLWMLRVRMAY